MLTQKRVHKKTALRIKPFTCLPMYVTSFNVPSIWTRRAALSHLTEKIKVWRGKGAYPWSCTRPLQGSWNGLLGKSRFLWVQVIQIFASIFRKGLWHRYSAWLCNSHCYHSSYWNFLMPRLRISHWLIRGLSSRTFLFVTQLMLPFHHLAFSFSFLHTSTTFYTNTDAICASRVPIKQKTRNLLTTFFWG